MTERTTERTTGLTPADRALAEADLAVPGIAAVLDAATLADRLAPHWAVTEARITYLRYKPGTSLVAGLHVRTAGGATHQLQGLALGAGATDKLAKVEHAGTQSRAGLGAVVDREAGVALADARADRALPGLAREADRAARSLVYKPGRRWVGQAEGLILKVHRPAFLSRALVGHQHLLGHRLAVPELVAVRPRRGVVRTGYVPGTPLDVHGGQHRWGEVGELLAALQAVPARPELPMVDRAAMLAAAVGAVQAVVPDAAAAALEATALIRTALADRVQRSVVHGDFSADQVIAGPDRLTVVDLDRVGLDDPLADVASWVAAEIATGRAPGDADPGDLVAPLLHGYTRAGGGLDVAALQALTAAELLLRAAEPFRRHQPDWPARVRELVERTHDLARRAGARPPRPAGVQHGHARPGARPPRRPAGVQHGHARPPQESRSPAGTATSVVAPEPIRHRVPDTVGDLRVVRVWPRGTDHALLELVAPDGAGVAGQWFADHLAQEAAPAVMRRVGQVLLHPAGVDPRLPALERVLARPGAELVAHRPGRRAVVRVSTRRGTEYVKVVRRSKAPGLAERGSAVAAMLAGTGVVVPELLGHPTDGALRWSDVGGSTLHDLAQRWSAKRARDAWERAGRAVAVLHTAAAPATTARHGVTEEIAAIDAWLTPAVAHGLLDGAVVIRARGRVVEMLHGQREGPLGVLHRDLHDKQLLLRPDGRIGMIDVDTLAVGERALDVANVVEHLELRRLQGHLTAAVADACRAGLLTGLGEAYTAVEDRVPAYRAAARLRLAGVYAYRPRWRPLARALLERL